MWAVTSALPAIQVCTDINECETGQHNCVPNSVCVNTRVRPGRSGIGSRHWGWVRSGRQPKLTARGPGPGLLPVRPLPAWLRGRPDIWLQAALRTLLPRRHAQPVPRESRLHSGTRWLAIVHGEWGGQGGAWHGYAGVRRDGCHAGAPTHYPTRSASLAGRATGSSAAETRIWTASQMRSFAAQNASAVRWAGSERRERNGGGRGSPTTPLMWLCPPLGQLCDCAQLWARGRGSRRHRRRLRSGCRWGRGPQRAGGANVGSYVRLWGVLCLG